MNDDLARRAANELGRTVAVDLDVDVALERLHGNAAVRGLRRTWRGPSLGVAAALLAVVGLVTYASAGDPDDGAIVVEEIEIAPAARDDGRDSIRLPIAAEPSTDLVDGQMVSIRGEGFHPGEQVGVVMCSAAAGGDQRQGIDACEIGSVTYADADSDGRIATSYAVRRVIDVPYEGGVDCAEVDQRCLIGVGALDDYDRSGGVALNFAGAPPLPPPAAMTAEPSEGLREGDTVVVRGEGFVPGTDVWVSQCGGDIGCLTIPATASALRADEAGRVAVEVVVARRLPGFAGAAASTTYDCLEHACSLRLHGDTGALRTPSSVRLSFDPGGPLRPVPELSVTPSDQVRDREVLTVTGRLFAPGTAVQLAVCTAGPAGDFTRCFALRSDDTDGSAVADNSGTFAVPYRVPRVLTVVDDQGVDTPITDCAGAPGRCAVWALTVTPGDDLPALAPEPVPLSFTP